MRFAGDPALAENVQRAPKRHSSCMESRNPAGRWRMKSTAPGLENTYPGVSGNCQTLKPQSLKDLRFESLRLRVHLGIMKPVRFIHTSDIHLDTSFSGSGFSSRLGDRKREAIRATFRRIVEDARSHEVDFLLVAEIFLNWSASLRIPSNSLNSSWQAWMRSVYSSSPGIMIPVFRDRLQGRILAG